MQRRVRHLRPEPHLTFLTLPTPPSTPPPEPQGLIGSLELLSLPAAAPLDVRDAKVPLVDDRPPLTIPTETPGTSQASAVWIRIEGSHRTVSSWNSLERAGGDEVVVPPQRPTHRE